MTPAQLNLMAEASGERMEAELEARKAEIYNLAALIRPMIWAKHPPKFESVFPKRKKDAMDEEELYRQAALLQRMLGGEMEEL